VYALAHQPPLGQGPSPRDGVVVNVAVLFAVGELVAVSVVRLFFGGGARRGTRGKVIVNDLAGDVSKMELELASNPSVIETVIDKSRVEEKNVLLFYNSTKYNNLYAMI
jgi:hypothetical protein